MTENVLPLEEVVKEARDLQREYNLSTADAIVMLAVVLDRQTSVLSQALLDLDSHLEARLPLPAAQLPE